MLTHRFKRKFEKWPDGQMATFLLLVFPKSPALPEFWKKQNSKTGQLAIWPFCP